MFIIVLLTLFLYVGGRVACFFSEPLADIFIMWYVYHKRAFKVSKTITNITTPSYGKKDPYPHLVINDPSLPSLNIVLICQKYLPYVRCDVLNMFWEEPKYSGNLKPGMH